ncbi:MAG: trehalose-6-phosphate synthase, partial [Erythrobacter sp.]|nr:trehalose-6-phosphate synthase [Erythrobacter sp.]
MSGEDQRLVVISNRVAVPKARGAAGAQGGLAGALNSALNDRGGVWFGWSGEVDDNPGEAVHIHEDEGVTTATIDLTHRELDEYYNGYANETLWPLFHYRIDLARFEQKTGEGYERVNERFAECVTPLIDEGDLVWVHDYHLIPLGDRLRQHGITNRMGF